MLRERGVSKDLVPTLPVAGFPGENLSPCFNLLICEDDKSLLTLFVE